MRANSFNADLASSSTIAVPGDAGSVVLILLIKIGTNFYQRRQLAPI